MRARLESFRHAGAGIAATVANDANMRIHLGVAACVVAAGAWLELSRGDWCWLVLAIALVLAAECTNSALEALADAAVPERHPLVGRAKDAAAGAVLILAVGAAGIGLLVLGPPLFAWWEGA